MRLSIAIVLIVAALACVQLSVQAAAASKPTAATPATPAAAAAAPAISYYELLGVTQSEASDASLLKKAYRKLALQHHPDKATSDAEKREKQDLFVRLANAYEILSSTRLRMRYELLVSQGLMEYDARRDWTAYDISRGFKPKPKTKAQQEAEFKSDALRDARAYDCSAGQTQRPRLGCSFSRSPLFALVLGFLLLFAFRLLCFAVCC